MSAYILLVSTETLCVYVYQESTCGTAEALLPLVHFPCSKVIACTSSSRTRSLFPPPPPSPEGTDT